jgi:hypothetical protein
MFQNSRSEGRAFRFGRSFLLVTAISSGILMAVLSGIAKTPAKPALDEFTDNTGRALAQLTPMALGRRYMDIVESRLNPCLHVPYGDAIRQCYAAHPGNPSNADTLTSLFVGFFSLLRQIFAESWTQSAIDIFQLIAGFILAVTLISLPKSNDFVMHPLFGFFFFAFWIGCASVLSYLTVLILHIGAGTLNDMLPSQTGLSVAGGAWGGLVITWASRTIEDALSHGTGHIVEHTLKSIFRFGK